MSRPDGVVILGAGLAGLSAAVNLGKGYEVFEASDRAGYASSHYPASGCMQPHVDALVQRVKAINFGQRAIEIDPERKKVVFDTGYTAWYDSLISTIPLPELVKIIKDAPGDINDAAGRFDGQSKKDVPGIMDYLHSRSILSIGRCGARGCSSMEDAITEGVMAAKTVRGDA